MKIVQLPAIPQWELPIWQVLAGGGAFLRGLTHGGHAGICARGGNSSGSFRAVSS